MTEPTVLVRFADRPFLTARVAGIEYRIPHLWLVGATRSLEQQGYSPKAALRSALQQWHEQAELHASRRRLDY